MDGYVERIRMGPLLRSINPLRKNGRLRTIGTQSYPRRSGLHLSGNIGSISPSTLDGMRTTSDLCRFNGTSMQGTHRFHGFLHRTNRTDLHPTLIGFSCWKSKYTFVIVHLFRSSFNPVTSSTALNSKQRLGLYFQYHSSSKPT